MEKIKIDPVAVRTRIMKKLIVSNHVFIDGNQIDFDALGSVIAKHNRIVKMCAWGRGTECYGNRVRSCDRNHNPTSFYRLCYNIRESHCDLLKTKDTIHALEERLLSLRQYNNGAQLNKHIALISQLYIQCEAEQRDYDAAMQTGQVAARPDSSKKRKRLSRKCKKE